MMRSEKKNTTITALLAVSVLINLCCLGFAGVQKAAADEARDAKTDLETKYSQLERFAREQQELVSLSRLQVQEVRATCEMRLRALKEKK